MEGGGSGSAHPDDVVVSDLHLIHVLFATGQCGQLHPRANTLIYYVVGSFSPTVPLPTLGVSSLDLGRSHARTAPFVFRFAARCAYLTRRGRSGGSRPCLARDRWPDHRHGAQVRSATIWSIKATIAGQGASRPFAMAMATVGYRPSSKANR